MDFAAWEVLLVGILIVFSLLSKAVLKHLDLVGYLLIGAGLQALNGAYTILTPESQQLLTFLAEFGVVSQSAFGVVVAMVVLTMVGVPLTLRGLLPT